MKTLHLYLTRQILASLLMTVLVFTFVLLLANVLKEVLPFLGQVKLSVVAQAVGLLIPWVLVFGLPMGMLTATLLIFGRFSADQELTAARASGISLVSLVGPILWLSLALCGVSGLVNLEIGPRCRVLFTSMRDRLLAEFSSVYLPERRIIRDFPGYNFYVGRNRKGELQDIRIMILRQQTNVDEYVSAPRGRMDVDSVNHRLKLTLHDCTSIPVNGDKLLTYSDEASLELDLQSAPQSGAPKVDDMTFRQLRQELRLLEQQMSSPLILKGLSPEQRQAKKIEWEKERREWVTRVTYHMHRQVAFSFACFGFTLVGIPLGIRMHRRETNIGIAMALGLVAIYYAFIVAGQALNSRPEYFPHLIVWAPNFLFQTVGAFLLWRVNR